MDLFSILLTMMITCIVILFFALKNVENTTGEFQHIRRAEEE